MTLQISGKTAIVTGAANGIGLAIARHFVEEGANVMCADMDEARLVEELGDVANEDGAPIRFYAGDLRERLTQANLLSATIDAFERVDILINASRQILKSDPLSSDDNSLEIMIEQNLMTSYRMSQVIARRMIQQSKLDPENGPAGSIINLSSIAARRTRDDLLGYSVSTAALEQMTRSMAVALAPHRIRVNAVAFGSVMSASLHGALREDEDLRQGILEGTPLGRIASPVELAEAVQFLAADASGFMTGQVMNIDGGRGLTDVVQGSAH